MTKKEIGELIEKSNKNALRVMTITKELRAIVRHIDANYNDSESAQWIADQLERIVGR